MLALVKKNYLRHASTPASTSGASSSTSAYRASASTSASAYAERRPHDTTRRGAKYESATSSSESGHTTATLVDTIHIDGDTDSSGDDPFFVASAASATNSRRYPAAHRQHSTGHRSTAANNSVNSHKIKPEPSRTHTTAPPQYAPFTMDLIDLFQPTDYVRDDLNKLPNLYE